VPEEAAESATESSPAASQRILRKKAVRILRDLPRVIRELDIPETQRTCTCCGGSMRLFGIERSEHLHYIPAVVQIVETRRKMYACGSCHSHIVRAPMPNRPPLPKSMASPSLIASDCQQTR
jgi:transposase